MASPEATPRRCRVSGAGVIAVLRDSARDAIVGRGVLVVVGACVLVVGSVVFGVFAGIGSV